MSTLLLDQSTVESLLDPAELLDVLASALIEISRGDTTPARIAARAPTGLLAAMPAYAAGQLACKLVSVFAANHGTAAPSHQALVGLFDGRDGSPIAVLEGAAITGARTAAIAALSVRALASPQAKVLTVLGAGVQARAHLQAVPRVRAFKEIRVASRTRAHAEQLAAETGARAMPDIETAVRGADVVCACTNAAEPVLRREWLSPGAHVTSVGIGGHELDAATLDAAEVLTVESDTAFLPFPAGAHELQGRDPRRAVWLGALLAQPVPHPGRPRISVCKLVGHAVEDAAVAAWIFRRAQARGLGTEFQFRRA